MKKAGPLNYHEIVRSFIMLPLQHFKAE